MHPAPGSSICRVPDLRGATGRLTSRSQGRDGYICALRAPSFSAPLAARPAPREVSVPPLSSIRPGLRATRARVGAVAAAEVPRAGDDHRLPGDRKPRRDLDQLCAGVRRAGGARSVRTDRSEGAAGRRWLSLRQRATSTAAPRCRRSATACPACSTPWRCRTSARRAVARAPSRGPSSPRAPDRRVRTGRRRSPAVRAVLVGHHGHAEADRARPRRHPARAPQGAGAARRPRAGRSVLLVHDHRLDDVELPRQRAADRRGDRHVRRRPGATPTLDALWQLAAETGITWFGASAPYYMACRKAGLRPVSSSICRGCERSVDRCAAAGRRVPLGLRRGRPRRDAVVDQRRNRHLLGVRRRVPDGAGGRRRDLVPLPRRGGRGVRRQRGHSVVGEQGELVITEPMPSMPIGFWGDDDGSRYRAAYFDTYPGVWRHGDWITIDEQGQLRDHRPLRRDAEPRRRAHRHQRDLPRRRGHRRCQRQPDRPPRRHRGWRRGPLVLFVVPSATACESTNSSIRSSRRCAATSRRATSPTRSIALPSIPTTLSGKKLELPVKKILRGADPDSVASRGALKNPESLDAVADLARTRPT